MMRGSVPLVIGVAVVGMASSAWAGNWRSLGPAPIDNPPFTGRVTSLAPSPTDPDLVYAGSATGGVWRLEGAGPWVPLTDDLPTGAIGAVAVDPFDDTVIYAGSGEANYAFHSFYGLGLYKSEDAGDTWTVLGEDAFAGRTFSRIVVSPGDPDVVYAAIMHAGGFPPRVSARGHPRADDAVGVYRSTDAGSTWALLSGGLPAVAASDLAISPADPQTLYAAIGDPFGNPDNGVYRSLDGGDTWTELGGGLPTGDIGRISLAVAPSMDQRIYALVTDAATSTGGGASTRGSYRSDDGGATWTAGSPGGQLQATYGWYLSVASVSPADPDTVFFGGVNMVRSQNAGAGFGDVTPPHVDIHALAWDADGRLLVGDDGGVHRSTNDGSSWSTLNDGLGIIQFYPGVSIHPTEATYLIGGAQDNGTNLRRPDGTWWQVLGADGGYTALHPSVPDTVMAEWQGTTNIYRSTNGGANFVQSSTGISPGDRNAFMPPMAHDPADADVVLLGTHRVYRSTNGGVAWTPISGDLTAGPPAAIRALAIAPSNGMVVYAATNDSRVLVSNDGGETFDLELTDADGWGRVTRELAVDPGDDQAAVVTTARFGVDQVRLTTDGGDTWTGIDGSLPDVPATSVTIARVASTRMIVVGTDRGAHVTCDDGTTWAELGADLPHSPVIDVRVDDNARRFVVATMGRGAWELDLDDVTVPPSCAGGDTGTGTGTPSTGSGGSSAGTSATPTSSSSSGGATSDGPPSGSGDGSAGSGPNGSGSADGTATDGGCGCRAPQPGREGLALLALLAWLPRRSRRRRS